jgi:hypothetical protein
VEGNMRQKAQGVEYNTFYNVDNVLRNQLIEVPSTFLAALRDPMIGFGNIRIRTGQKHKETNCMFVHF